MELRQLKYFVKIAEVLNFSDASKSLFVTQSTLSQQIKQLEQELGTPLFERTSHQVTLTEAGSELLPLARTALYDAGLCMEKIRDLNALLIGTLNIGVTYSFSPILTETLVTFMKSYPGVKLNIYYKSVAELMDMLRRREVDFVLAFRPSVCDPDIESHILFQNCLSVIVGENHPLAAADSEAHHGADGRGPGSDSVRLFSGKNSDVFAAGIQHCSPVRRHGSFCGGTDWLHWNHAGHGSSGWSCKYGRRNYDTPVQTLCGGRLYHI